MMKSVQTKTKSGSTLVSERIAELGDWRGETLSRMRKLILEVDPQIVEESKWGATPVWEKDGILCTGEAYKAAVKLTFARGAFLDDPNSLFNSSLEGNMRRAIDIPEGAKVNEKAFKALVRQAITLNEAKLAERSIGKRGKGSKESSTGKAEPSSSVASKAGKKAAKQARSSTSPNIPKKTTAAQGAATVKKSLAKKTAKKTVKK